MPLDSNCWKALVLAVSLSACGEAWAVSEQGIQAASDYFFRHGGEAMLVLEGDALVHSRYAPGYDPDQFHRLFSGSKSFTCVIAALAEDDHSLRWDQPISEVLQEWATPPRNRITVRQLLSLSSGVHPSKGAGVDSPVIWKQSVDAALSAGVQTGAGRRFGYGPYPFLIFGKVAEKALGESPDTYLQRRVLSPIGVEVAWIQTSDGYPHLADGALATAMGWLKFGQFMRDGGIGQGRRLIGREQLLPCFSPSQANSSYGAGWWLGPRRTLAANKTADLLEDREFVAARGSYNQGLYIFPAKDRVVVVLGTPGSQKGEHFNEATFLRLLGHIPQ